MGAFKAYDIRGVYGRDFDADTVYRIGRVLPSLLSADRVLIGRDARVSSPEIRDALCRGLTEAGAAVDDIGLCTTPMTYYFTGSRDYPAAVMITASHNPGDCNGLKISRRGALPVGFDTGLGKLEKLIAQPLPDPAPVSGAVVKTDVSGDYFAFLKSKLPDISGLRIAFDCSNGMSSLFARRLYGDAHEYLYEEIDGSFPNHSPNPLESSATAPLRALVGKGGFDLGVIFDGDADRVMFIDELGRFIRPDLITAVLAGYYLRREPGAPVLCDIRTSRGVTEKIARLGGAPYLWKVGHAFAKVKLRELGAVVGGELAGHYYFRDFFCCDSGLLCAGIVLGEAADAKRRGISFSRLAAEAAGYANSGECNHVITNKDAAIDALCKWARRIVPACDHVLDFDGYRFEWPDWWFNVRKSNTEPYLRIICEAADQSLLDEKLAELNGILARFETR